MKIKGITVWEQHVDKLVLGVAALVFLGFAATQFLGTTEVTSGKDTFTPSDIDEKLKKKAEDIQEKLSQNAEPVIQVPKVVATSLSGFDDELAKGISPRPTIAQTGPSIYPPYGDLVNSAVVYQVPTVPAPTGIQPEQFTEALLAEDVEKYPELKAKFPPDKPYDIFFATVFAHLDTAELKQQLHGGNPNSGAEGPRPIPVKWYNDRITVIDVVYEREEFDPAHGTWISSTLLEPIPGQPSLREQLKKELQVKDRDEILDVLSDPVAQLQVLQPAFYATRNDSWHKPSGQLVNDVKPADAEANPEAAEIARLKRLIAQKQAKLDDMNEKIKALGGPCEEDPNKPGKPKPPTAPPGDGAKPPPAGGGGFGFGGAGGGKGGRTGQGADAKDKEECIKLTRTAKKIESDLNRLKAELAKLTPEEVVVEKPTVDAGANDANEVDDMLIWGHDITVVPGKTYRYRVSVKVYNPFFAKRNNLVEAQKPLAADFTIASQMSEWSQPITISTPLRVFITKATPPQPAAAAGANPLGGLGLGIVTADIYRFYDGRWWNATFTVEPGDRIGKIEKEKIPGAKPEDPPTIVPIDYSTDLFVLDVVEDLDAGQDNPLGRSGGGAFAILQNLLSGEPTPRRDPRVEAADPQRTWLGDQVKQSEL